MALDIDSGGLVAVKQVRWPEHGPQSHHYTMLKREVEALASMSHVSEI